MKLEEKSIIAITGPSGAGKTTLGDKLNNLTYVGTPKHCTTRRKRSDDKDGFYRYLTHEEYKQLNDNGEFLISSGDGPEIDKKYGNFYGVLIDDCIETWKTCSIIILFVSYKDLNTLIKLKEKGLNIDIINLTFNNIEKGVKNRLHDSKRDHTEEEIRNRVNCAKEYENLFGETIRKNSTSGYVTKEFQKYLEENKNTIKKIVFVGVCLDICVINIAIPTKMYFNENNIDCEIIVPENATETFDAPNHSREEYKVLAKKMLQLNGIKVPERYER